MTFLKLTKTNRAADSVVVAVDAICSLENSSEAKCTRVYCIDGFWHEVRERIPDIIKAMEGTGDVAFSTPIGGTAETITPQSVGQNEVRHENSQGNQEVTFPPVVRESNVNPSIPSLPPRQTSPIQMSFCTSFKSGGRRNQRAREFRKRITGKHMSPPGVENSRPR